MIAVTPVRLGFVAMSAAAALAASGTAFAQGAAGSVKLVPHVAVYDLSLTSSRGKRALEGVRGRIVYLASVCGLYLTLLWAVHERRLGLVLALATASAVFHAVEYLVDLTMQTELGACLIEQLADLARRQSARDVLLLVKARRCAEPADARPRSLQLGDCLLDERRVDSHLGGDGAYVSQRTFDTGTVRAFLQLGGTLQDQGHLLIGIPARLRGSEGHDENMEQGRTGRQRTPPLP